MTQRRKFSLFAEKDALKIIPREHSIAVAYLANQAWEACMQPELSEIATSLLVLQALNKKEQSQQLTNKINAVRNIIFGAGKLAEEMEYNALPAETKQVLNSISAFQQPFDAIALFEDVWGLQPIKYLGQRFCQLPSYRERSKCFVRQII